MRWIVAFVVTLVAGTAAAQPVSYKLSGDVPVGQKPAIVITAAQKLTDLTLELSRDDGKQFIVKHPALAKGKTVSLAVGDGAAGKASYQGKLSAVTAQGPWSGELTFETIVRAPMKVTYDIEHLDLDKRILEFKLSRPAASAELTVIGEDGKELGTGQMQYRSPSPDDWLSITWTQSRGTRVMIMRLRVVAADGVATNVELVPWSIAIEHDDVKFATDSAVIEPGERTKLDATLPKIADIVKRADPFMKVKLFVAGHTDTVGPTDKNRKLSLDRARAIAAYLRKQGVKIPIAYAGFGEDVLKVKTADATDQPANRRVDYVIGPAAAPPPFKGPYLAARATWMQIK